MSLSVVNYTLLQYIVIIINLGLNISWKEFPLKNFLPGEKRPLQASRPEYSAICKTN